MGSGEMDSREMVAEGWQSIADSEELLEGGDGIRFELERPGRDVLPAFCVRFDGQARAYLNRCAHVPVELDWQPGKFFDDTGVYLICATHGAMYEADTGSCIAGPCRGQSLRSLLVTEMSHKIWVKMPSVIPTSPPPLEKN